MYKIAFLLFPEFQLLGFTNAIEALRVANSLFTEPKFDVRIVHDDTDVVLSSGGMPVVATHGHVSTQHDADSLIVCCSFHHDQYLRDTTQHLIRRFDRHGMRLGSIESGVYHLARAGVLNGHSVTAHFNNFPLFAQLFPDVSFIRQVFTFSPTRMTAAGGTACLDMMLALIREQLGPDVEARVANMLIHPYRRESATFLDDMFTSSHSGLPLAVRNCCKIMEQHLDPPLLVEDIATKLRLSRRQLDRIFLQSMHCTAAEHYRLIRLARARKLIKATKIDLATISTRCGFGSYSHFLRRYRETFGSTPSHDRITADIKGLNSTFSPLQDLHPNQQQMDPIRLI